MKTLKVQFLPNKSWLVFRMIHVKDPTKAKFGRLGLGKDHLRYGRKIGQTHRVCFENDCFPLAPKVVCLETVISTLGNDLIWQLDRSSAEFHWCLHKNQLELFCWLDFYINNKASYDGTMLLRASSFPLYLHFSWWYAVCQNRNTPTKICFSVFQLILNRG